MKTSNRQSFPLILAIAATGLIAISSSALHGSAAMDSGSFYVKAENVDEPEIVAYAGINGSTAGGSGVEGPAEAEPAAEGRMVFEIDTNNAGLYSYHADICDTFDLSFMEQDGVAPDLTIDWGEGEAEPTKVNAAGVYSNEYSVDGEYTVTLEGTFPWMMFGSTTNWYNDAACIKTVSKWDATETVKADQLFRNAYNLTDVANMPSTVTSMIDMFNYARTFNGDISDWDVSNVTSMNGLFSYAGSFNQDLSGWDVSKVNNMGNMFQGATSFNGDISTWDVSGVTHTNGMFHDAISFDQDLNDWDVSNFYQMASMFQGATSFNGDISGWKPSKAFIMSTMFHGATSFDRDISSWDVSKVHSMHKMFDGASSMSADLSGWNVPRVRLSDDFNKNSPVISPLFIK